MEKERRRRWTEKENKRKKRGRKERKMNEGENK